MDIINIAENYVGVSVEARVFIAAWFQLVYLGIEFWSGIVDYNPRIIYLAFIRRFSNLANHNFILNGAIIHNTIHALTRPPHGAPRFFIIIA